ncbi:MAG: hypothetical protein AYK18_17410 [Theionarchaea archaeon DG-70]|nr:MAG: hypothetical protein AYK18_17410 [Theionarchaea archaeon DG-70]
MKPFLTIATVCSIVITVVAPPEIKLVGIFLLFCIPGFAIISVTFPQKDIIDQVILSCIAGLAFHIVYAYILSLVFHFSFPSLFLPALFLAILLDFKKRCHFEIDKKTVLIVLPAIFFAAATVNLVPGEDANFHLLALNEVESVKAVPETYSLYPEIGTVMYPFGFHILTAQLQLFSGVDNFIFTFASVLTGVLCLSVYWCTKRLFSPECGLLAGVLSVFAVLPPLNSVVLSTYANLLAYIFTCAAIGVVADCYKRDSPTPFVLLSLILAAGVETHLSFFLILIPVFIFLLEKTIKKRDTVRIKYIPILLLSVVLSAPFLVRISAQYTPYDVGRFLSLWYNPLQFTPSMIPERIGTWMTIVSIPGFFLLKKYRILFSAWIGVFLFLAVNTVIRIEFPLWYVFFATRMVDQLFLPFSILGAFFLVKMWKFSRIGIILLCAILLLTGSIPLIEKPRADRGVLFPTISPFFATDQEGMVWLLTTDEDAIILNEWWTATGSAWIPSLAQRRVIFPYIFSLEHYTDVLNIPEKEQKTFVIAAFPDSEEVHNSLKEWGVDYIFLSAYVLDEAKWRNALWNQFVLQESPNYSLVFQEGYTYIFRVSPYFEYTTTFVLKEDQPFTVTSETPEILDVSLNPVSFSVDRILDIFFEDSHWGEFEIRTGNTILAVVPLTDTGKKVHTAFRIPPGANEITVLAKNNPVQMAISVSAAFFDSFQYSDNIALVGEWWKKTEKGYELENQGHIYLFNGLGILEITYVDRGEGNIDFNLFIDGEWHKLATVYRENDGRTKTILLEISEDYTLLDIGIHNWGDPLVIVGLKNLGCSKILI